MKDKWYVYAILCSNGSVYIGQTNNLLNRWELHKKGKGARWTKKWPPIKLFYFEEIDSYKNALHRERELKKSTGRRMLKGLLQKVCLSADEPTEKLLERIKIVGANGHSPLQTTERSTIKSTGRSSHTSPGGSPHKSQGRIKQAKNIVLANSRSPGKSRNRKIK